MKAADIIAIYDQCKSIKKTGELAGISACTVTKLLITHGIYPSDRSKEVHRLMVSGYTQEEICAKLEISSRMYNRYIPYTRGSYVVGPKSTNAIKINRWRKKKRG